MPSFVELQRRIKSQGKIVETRLDSTAGEEALVVDERSRRSCSRMVEDKLGRLTRNSPNFLGAAIFQR